MGGRPPDLDAAARRQADAVADALESVLPTGTLAGLAMYGSAVAGGLRPDSDLDLFGIVGRRLMEAEKGDLVGRLVPLSWQRLRPVGWRPVELTLVVHAEVRPWRYPPRFDFQYGEWLREELLAGNLAPWPSANPDVAMLVTMVRAVGIAIRGPDPAALLDAVPHADVVRATLDDLPALMSDLDSDTRNVLLTLARMWFTIATGAVTGKDGAASWAVERVPPDVALVLERARDGYLGSVADRWDDLPAARATADDLVARIRSAAEAG